MRLAGTERILRIAGILVSINLLAQELSVRVTPDQIQVAAPKLHFLSGKPMERLRHGNAIPFDFQLSVLNDSKQVLRQTFERFVVSYDIWEERFSVTRTRGTRASVSNLTAVSAEAWCLDNLSMPGSGLPQDRPVWVRLDIRAQEARQSKPLESDEVLSLANLIEIFSRPGKQGGNQWRIEAGPLQFRDLRKSAGRTGT